MERFDRLLEEQRKAIVQTDEKIASLRKFIGEYEDLRGRLEEMSRCFSKEALVPFSPKALIPARFVHTNEVLVYLGGHNEHFCEVSTHQSFKIIDKRIERIQESIKKLEEQRKLLTDREGYTQKLVRGEDPQSIHDGLGEEDGGFEIREEYDPEKEKEWLEKHKKSVQKELAKEREEAKNLSKKSLILSRRDDQDDNDDRIAEKGDPQKKKISFEDVEVKKLEDNSSPSHITFADGKKETNALENESSFEDSYLPDIEASHSDNPPRPIVVHLTDWSKASPADVVNFVRRSGKKTKGILKKSDMPCSPTAVVEKPKPVHTEVISSDDSNAAINKPAPFLSPFVPIIERNAPGRDSNSSEPISSCSSPQLTDLNSSKLDNTSKPVPSNKPVSRFRLQHMSK